jgi:hypothetical protein
MGVAISWKSVVSGEYYLFCWPDEHHHRRQPAELAHQGRTDTMSWMNGMPKRIRTVETTAGITTTKTDRDDLGDRLDAIEAAAVPPITTNARKGLENRLKAIEAASFS